MITIYKQELKMPFTTDMYSQLSEIKLSMLLSTIAECHVQLYFVGKVL
jgi:hypothetical protein